MGQYKNNGFLDDPEMAVVADSTNMKDTPDKDSQEIKPAEEMLEYLVEIPPEIEIVSF